MPLLENLDKPNSSEPLGYIYAALAGDGLTEAKFTDQGRNALGRAVRVFAYSRRLHLRRHL